MKINPIDYLFYKIYKALSFISGGGNPITQYSAILILFSFNVLVLLNILYEDVPSEIAGTWIAIVGILILPYYMIREDRIIAKYSQESEHSRTVGNMIVAIYVILTFVMLIWTA